MKQRRNYYEGYMSDDYARLRELLDRGNVLVGFVNYDYDTGGRHIVFRDVVKIKSNDYNPSSKNYGYVIEARGIVYGSWDGKKLELQGRTFEDECERLRLQFIDYGNT